MLEIKRVFEAYLDAYNLITILVPKSYYDGISDCFVLQKEEEVHDLVILDVIDIGYARKYECSPSCFIEIGHRYDVMDRYGNKTDLQIGAIIRRKEFEGAFYYEGDDLGAIYTKEKTIWKVWAPTASQLKLCVYNKEEREEYEMQRQEAGIWSYELPGDCEYVEYTYLSCINLVWREATDPYSVATTASSERSIVIDMSKTGTVTPIAMPFTQMTDAVIYEAHIRDLTIQREEIEHRGKYKGLTETADNKASIGIAYMKELGITHLELLPFNDYGGVDEERPYASYNWGYNPIHFNVPEGSYSTNSNDPYSRIRELKELITTLHENGIRIIMDVVYNHVYIYEDSSFEKLVPGYYFRYDENGMLSNGTGVGNDVASERAMVSKFILDSVKFWVNEYGVDGFRFDLMGILDVDTMNTIRQTVNEINPNIILLGEGWNLNTPLPYGEKAALHNARKMPGIAFFNDQYRDVIKGSTFEVKDKGYVCGDSAKKEVVKHLITGSVLTDSQGHSMFFHPTQTINYVECHDNYTMWDKIIVSNQSEDDVIKRKRHVLATSFVLLSQGIPFLQAGQEFYRTKQGVENSYNASDEINQIDWERRDSSQDTVNYVKGLIQLRKSHGAFRFATGTEVKQYVKMIEINEKVIGYHMKGVKQYGKWNEILVFFNTGTEQIPLMLDDHDWIVLVQGQSVNVEGIGKVTEDVFQLLPLSVSVLIKE